MSDKIELLATFPTLQSWTNISGDPEEGARIKLDFPASEMAGVARLILLRGKVLRVTIEPE